MVLTAFADIGKSSKDIFTKYFKCNLINFDFKSKTDDDVDVHIQCNDENSQMLASADITIRPIEGVAVKTKVDSNNQLISEVEFKNKSFDTQHKIIGTIDQNLSKKNLKLKNCLKKENVNAEVEMDFASKLPVTTASLAVGDKEYIAGAEVIVDTDGFKVTKHSYSIGYIGNNFETYGFFNNNKEVEWRLFQSYKKFSLGWMFGFIGNLTNTRFGIASLYKVNDETFVKAKVDQNSRLSLAYGFKPTPETQVVVTMNTALSRNESSSTGGLTFEISN
nr:Voltage dependent anion selective channel [Hymenolepis microstoma]